MKERYSTNELLSIRHRAYRDTVLHRLDPSNPEPFLPAEYANGKRADAFNLGKEQALNELIHRKKAYRQGYNNQELTTPRTSLNLALYEAGITDYNYNKTQPRYVMETLTTFDITEERKSGQLKRNVAKYMGLKEQAAVQGFDCPHCEKHFDQFNALQRHYKESTGESMSMGSYKALIYNKKREPMFEACVFNGVTTIKLNGVNVENFLKWV